jgi:hypothetical protein
MNIPEAARTAVSLLRWSTKGQRLGHSELRQLEKADSFVRDESLLLLDRIVLDGVSGFQGWPLQHLVTRVERGELKFDVLLVEALDRLSRAKPRRTFTLFLRLIDAGIEIVTFNPFRRYTEQEIDNNHLALFETLMLMVVANTDSERKSGLNADKWSARRTMVSEDNPRDVLTARSFGWLRCVEEGGKRWFEPIPGRAELVEWIWTETANGRSQESIVHELNQRNEPCFGNGKRIGKMWRNSHVRAILKSKAPAGILETGRVEWVHDKDKDRYRRQRVEMREIPNRLPKIIDDDDVIIRVQAMVTQRAVQVVTRVGIQSTLAGLTTCALCGASMTRKSNGAGHGRPRLVCTAAKHRKGCVFKTVRLEEVEAAVFERATLDWPSSTVMGREIADLEMKLQMSVAECAAVLAAVRQNPTPQLTALLRKLETEGDARERHLAEMKRRVAALNEARAYELDRLWHQEPRDIARTNALARSVWETVLVNVETREATVLWKSLGLSTTVEF